MSKKYLVVKGYCGLGNRIHCLVGAIVYSELTNRKLIVDWGDGMYEKEGENVFPKLFSLEGAKYTFDEIADSKSVYPSMWKGNLKCDISQIMEKPNWYPFGEMHLPSCDLSKIDYEQDVIVYTAYVHNLHRIPKHALKKSKYASMSKEQIIKQILTEVLKLSPMVKEQIDLFAEKNFTHPIVGVHVRFTDLLVGFSNGAYHKQIKKMLKKNPDLRIFLATDNRKVELEFKKLYRNVITTNKWFPESAGKPIHYYCDSDKRFQMGVDALSDMCLLGMCDYLIYHAYSTFTFYTRNSTAIPMEKQFALRTGGTFIEAYRQVRWKFLLFKQHICRILFKRNTLLKTPVRNLSLIDFTRALREELRPKHSKNADRCKCVTD